MGEGFDELGNKATDWADHKAGQIAKHPKRTMFIIIGVVVLLAIVGTVLGIAQPWASEAKFVISPSNVVPQYKAIIGDWQSLTATADNACNAQNSTQGSGDPTLVENPAFAYRATYFKIRTDYNTRMHDIFEAKKVAPTGYPNSVPDFPETHQKNGDWCNVSSELLKIHG